MSKQILIVDDSPVVLAMLEDALVGMGYGVTAAANGEEGLKQVEARKFDLIITDLSMPVMDGISFVKAVKLAAQLQVRADRLPLLRGGRSQDRRGQAGRRLDLPAQAVQG